MTLDVFIEILYVCVSVLLDVFCILGHLEMSEVSFMINLNKNLQKDRKFLLNHICTISLFNLSDIVLAAEKFNLIGPIKFHHTKVIIVVFDSF